MNFPQLVKDTIDFQNKCALLPAFKLSKDGLHVERGAYRRPLFPPDWETAEERTILDHISLAFDMVTLDCLNASPWLMKLQKIDDVQLSTITIPAAESAHV